MTNLMRWSPAGEMKIFATAADVPANWTDYHPASAPVRVTVTHPDVEMSRQELIVELERGGIPFKKNATTPALKLLLRLKACEVLREGGIEFDESAPIKSLLALLPALE